MARSPPRTARCSRTIAATPSCCRLADARTGPFPRGGCWERFLTILDRRDREYWLQLDSDTVTLGPVDEVADAIARNRSFTLLGGVDGEIGALPFAEFVGRRYPDGPMEGHVQHRVEIAPRPALATLRPALRPRLCGVRGLRRGGPGRELAQTFLEAMEQLIGREAVTAWGTEQLASNFHIANEPEPVLLPYARYLNYWGEPWDEGAAFVHFVGSHRYENRTYATASRKVIDELRGVGV